MGVVLAWFVWVVDGLRLSQGGVDGTRRRNVAPRRALAPLRRIRHSFGRRRRWGTRNGSERSTEAVAGSPASTIRGHGSSLGDVAEDPRAEEPGGSSEGGVAAGSTGVGAGASPTSPGGDSSQALRPQGERSPSRLQGSTVHEVTILRGKGKGRQSPQAAEGSTSQGRR